MMRKLITISLILSLGICSLQAQKNVEKCVLFLIPFNTEQINQINRNVSSDQDILNIVPFTFVGFWEGARLALQQFEKEKVALKVIVRDVADNEAQLNQLLADEELMSQVDLIIGPLYANMFIIAAQYAKEHKIPIVNPFTNRRDILEDNPYVYKLMPPLSARCHDLIRRYLGASTHFVIWGNTAKASAEQLMYDSVFKANDISYSVIPLGTDLQSKLTPGKQYVILTFSDYTPTIMNTFRRMVAHDKNTNYTWIIPAEWIEFKELSLDQMNNMQINFYSDYYVNYNNDTTQLFISDFIEQFGSVPTLDRFAFQGYDVTRYFIQQLISDRLAPVPVQSPLAFKFRWSKLNGMGSENQVVRFCTIKDFEIIEVPTYSLYKDKTDK